MDPDVDLISTEIIQSFLNGFVPGSTIKSIRLLAGSYSNYTHLLEYQTDDGVQQQIVLRRYNPSNGTPTEKANLEFNTLAWLHSKGLPVAKPLYLDLDGSVLGSPGFAMSFVPGQSVVWPDYPPNDPTGWAIKVGKMLARIHSTPCEPYPKFLHDNNELALWFLRSGKIPDYIRNDPDGLAIWEAILDHMPDFKGVKKSLIHLDYWAGNLLWDGDEICLVVDWEEAGYGEPAIDVAYCLMDMILVGEPHAAEAFLDTYESMIGEKVEHLAFWELAAAIRPIHQPLGWIDQSPFQERFRRFITTALSEV